jgi:hypothetical protein
MLLALAVLTLVSTGCGDTEASSSAPAASETSLTGNSGPTDTAGATDTSAEGLPGPVAATRATILGAAEDGDYDQLRSVLDQEVFLSDYGFGNDQQDPIEAWSELGSRPLKTMSAVLRMRHVVRDTNEGTLYEWPRLNPDSEPEDMTSAERELFLSFMSEAELEEAFNPDYGYTAPRIGILADGTWWFFVAEPGP